MSNRSFLMLIVALGLPGCTRLAAREPMADSVEPVTAGRASTPGRATAPRSVPAADGGNGGRGASSGSARPASAGASAVRDVQPELALATTDACGLTSLAPAGECLEPDPAEPNDQKKPIALPIAPNCGYMEANISAGDDDAYTFSTSKSDPVLVELSYMASGKADLEQAIYGSTQNLLTSQRNTRMGAGENLRAIIQSSAGGTYTVRVTDSNDSDACQRYALRVDPLFCGDEYEDNDAADEATKLSWDANQRVHVQGKVLEDDEDYFEITTKRADPVQLTGSYTAAASSTVQVSRAIYDGAGSLKKSVAGARKTETESFTHWLPAPAKGSVLRTRLSATGSGCASYELQFDAAACTDAFEDNDRTTEAAKLASGTDVEATIYLEDDDYYALSGLKSGACTLTYDIPTGRSQQLQLGVYDGAGSLVNSRNGGDLSGSVRTLQVSWMDRESVTLKVSASEDGYCQPYKLRCDPVQGQ